jgi:hypothetical protein
MFNEQLFKSDAILTSDGIQERWQIAVAKRAQKTPIKVSDYWLLEEADTKPYIKVAHFSDSSAKNTFTSAKKALMKITEYIPEEERKNVDILYANIWKNALKILVSACALMILNIWLWEIFSRRENQKTVQMILSVFFVLCIGWFIYSACKKNSKNKVFLEINVYIPVFFAYSIYAMLMIV